MKTKYWLKCERCGEPQMYGTSCKKLPDTRTLVPAVECEICGHVQRLPNDAKPMPPILVKTVTNEDADAALKAIYDAASVLAAHADSAGTVFIGCVTVDRGKGNLGAGDFFIGEAETIAKALTRLLRFRPEFKYIMEYAIAQSAFEPFANISTEVKIKIDNPGNTFEPLVKRQVMDAFNKVDLSEVCSGFDNGCQCPACKGWRDNLYNKIIAEDAAQEPDNTRPYQHCPKCNAGSFNGLNCYDCGFDSSTEVVKAPLTAEQCAECGAMYGKHTAQCSKH